MCTCVCPDKKCIENIGDLIWLLFIVTIHVPLVGAMFFSLIFARRKHTINIVVVFLLLLCHFVAAYLSHLGSIVAYRYVSRAVSQSIDPRNQLVLFNDILEKDSCLTSEDVRMMWYFIMKEVCVCMYVCVYMYMYVTVYCGVHVHVHFSHIQLITCTVS